jgi:hypothetical protein
MRRVRDRKRKYLARKTKAGRLKRRQEYKFLANKRLALARANPNAPRSGQIVGGVTAATIAVGGYGQAEPSCLPFRQSPEVTEHDCQTSLGSQPRAPPADHGLVVD